MVGIFNHQVGIYGQGGAGNHCLGGGKTPGQIRHEVVIHNVQVHPVGRADGFQRIGEMHLVAVQHRGIDLEGHAVFSFLFTGLDLCTDVSTSRGFP